MSRRRRLTLFGLGVTLSAGLLGFCMAGGPYFAAPGIIIVSQAPLGLRSAVEAASQVLPFALSLGIALVSERLGPRVMIAAIVVGAAAEGLRAAWVDTLWLPPALWPPAAAGAAIAALQAPLFLTRRRGMVVLLGLLLGYALQATFYTHNLSSVHASGADGVPGSVYLEVFVEVVPFVSRVFGGWVPLFGAWLAVVPLWAKDIEAPR